MSLFTRKGHYVVTQVGGRGVPFVLTRVPTRWERLVKWVRAKLRRVEG